MKKFSAYFLIFYLIWIVRATVFYSATDLAIPGETGRLFFANLLKFVLWVLPATGYLLWIDRQNPLTVMRIRTPIEKRGICSVSLVTISYFVIIFGLEKLVLGRTLAPITHANALLLGITLAKVFFSPITEELLFRGFVLPKLNENLSFWTANALQAILFTAMHWPNWIWVNGFGLWILQASIAIFAIGILLGWVCKRTNFIWLSVLVHILNNFLVAFLE
jgi:membrane protease YdiL (CAAX protease family)